MTYLLRPLPGNPRYLISDTGDVWSIASSGIRKLRQSLDNHGYPRVDIYNGGRTTRQTMRVFLLVADAFGLVRDGNEIINHKDHDKTNSCLSNLEVVSRSENVRKWWDHRRQMQSSDAYHQS